MAGKYPKQTVHPLDRHIGLQLRNVRRQQGLSQDGLGKRIGLTFQQIQKYEKGTNRLSCLRLYEIARELDIPLFYFFEGYEEDDPALKSARRSVARRDTLLVTQLFDQLEDERLRKTFAGLLRVVVKGDGDESEEQ